MPDFMLDAKKSDHFASTLYESMSNTYSMAVTFFCKILKNNKLSKEPSSSNNLI